MDPSRPRARARPPHPASQPPSGNPLPCPGGPRPHTFAPRRSHHGQPLRRFTAGPVLHAQNRAKKLRSCCSFSGQNGSLGLSLAFPPKIGTNVASPQRRRETGRCGVIPQTHGTPLPLAERKLRANLHRPVPLLRVGSVKFLAYIRCSFRNPPGFRRRKERQSPHGLRFLGEMR